MMRFWHHVAIGLLPFILAACGGPAEPVWAPDNTVQSAVYKHEGPPKITIFTVVNVKSGSGGHSGLLINGDQRLLFDPAGTFKLPSAPERNDVHFGVTERVLNVYVDYHARQSWNVRAQEIEVTPQQARMLTQLVQQYGAVPKAQCTLSITRILKQVPGFERISVTYFPNSLSKELEQFSGVKTKLITDDDADSNHNVLFTAARADANG
ncbi:MAG: hypothetical protein ACR2O1_16415 [Boseongicola sp.]